MLLNIYNAKFLQSSYCLYDRRNLRKYILFNNDWFFWNYNDINEIYIHIFVGAYFTVFLLNIMLANIFMDYCDYSNSFTMGCGLSSFSEYTTTAQNNNSTNNYNSSNYTSNYNSDSRRAR